DEPTAGVIVSLEVLRQRITERFSFLHEDSDALSTAVRHLERHGFVKKIRRAGGEEALLLVPELLNNLAASFVLEARRNERGLGSIDEHSALRGEYPFPELSGLSTNEQEILLDATATLLIEHNVCFRATLGKRT